MCNSMKKPTGISGDDMTAKCQALSRSLVQLEEGDIFGDSDEDEPYFRAQPESNSDSSDEDEDEILTPSAATDSSSKPGLPMLTGCSEFGERKSPCLSTEDLNEPCEKWGLQICLIDI